MTWMDVEQVAGSVINREFPSLPVVSAERTAKRIVEELRIELAKRKWKGPLGDGDMAFFGDYEEKQL